MNAGGPRGLYYGWVLAFVLGLTEMVSWGILYYGFGVMLPHMRAEMGWSDAQASLAFSIASLANGLLAVFAGRWLDVRGPRALMTLGSVLGVACVLAWANVQSLWALYLVWLGVGIAMVGTLYEPAFWVVARWFSARRSRALTVVTFWGGLASTAFIPLANYLVQAMGWRQALLVLAGVLALCTIPPHALLLRRSPAELGLEVDGGTTGAKINIQNQSAPDARPGAGSLNQAARMPNFWLLFAAFFLSNIISGAVGVYFMSLQLARGEEAGYAAWAAGLVGVMQVVGRLTLAPLGDRMPRRYMTAFVIVLQAIALAVLALTESRAGLWVYVILFGLGHGTLTPMRASLIADVFGVRAYGAINGAISLGATVARGLAPVGLGLLISSLGNGYTTMLWAMVACGLGASLAVLMLDRTGAPKSA